MRAILLAIGSLALFACGEDASTDPPLATPSDVLIRAGAAGLGGNAYNPNNLTISLAAKQTVKWRNDDAVTHTVTATGAGPAFDSGSMADGATFTFTFTSAGIYPYQCTIHPTMAGSITVNP